MKKTVYFVFILVVLSSLSGWAQLIVIVSPPAVVGQKAIVSLKLTNDLAEPIKAARAMCFLLDKQGTMVGQSTKWIIGTTKGDQPLVPKLGASFNFLITGSQPFAQTNLVAKINFSHIVLESGRVLDIRKEVEIQNVK